MTKKYEPKNLAEVLADRKKFYLGKIGEAFDRVYASGNSSYIAQFEKEVSSLSVRIAESKLELLTAEPAQKKQPERKKAMKEPAADVRKNLTYYQYAKARNQGLTNEQIKEKFKTNSSYQICGFASTYAQRMKKQKAD